jgi:ADP-heptose:LPS heptosyltransferase
MSERWLVIKPSSLGDIIHGLQVIESIRSELDRPIRITWVCREIFVPFVRACKSVDEVLVFNRKGGVSAFFHLLKEIRATRYDVAIDYQGLFRSGLMMFAARANRKLGRSDARDGSTLFYSEKFKLPTTGAGSHAVEILLQSKTHFTLNPVLSSALKFKEKELSAKIPFPIENSVLIFPDSRRKEKEWPHFNELTQQIIEKEIPVIWCGADRIEADFSSDSFVNLMGALQLDELPTLIQAARVVIANDSGPMHLASAMRKKVIALFGPTNPALYGPYPISDPNHYVLRSKTGNMKDLNTSTVLDCLTRAYSDNHAL